MEEEHQDTLEHVAWLVNCNGANSDTSTPKAAMKLTDEQLNAVDLFKHTRSLKVSAFAGTGKTSTLVSMAHATQRKGLYLAFNKSIAADAAGRFPHSVACRTTHSLAFRTVAGMYKGNSDKLTQSLHGNRVAQLLNIKEIAAGNILLKPHSLAFLVSKTVQRFCQSGNDEIMVGHVPLTGKLQILELKYQQEFRDYVSKLAAHLWGLMIDPKSEAPMGHDGYLKLWSLTKPRLDYDFLLLDEAQDTNEAVLSVLRQQNSQLTLVGDRHQQIYEWRGAINAMANVETDAEAFLTQSFRFGDSVAAAATSILKILGETRAVIGDPNKDTRIAATGITGTTLCRTNVGVISVVIDALTKNRKPYVVGGVKDLVNMLEDVSRLKGSISPNCPEFFGFADWNEIVDFAGSEEGESLKSFVGIVETYGEAKLIQNLKSVSRDETGVDVIVSTGHKAKGREWDSVTLFSDFDPRLSKDDPPKQVLNHEEARLLYVAATRAKQRLVVPARLAEKWNATPGLSSVSEYSHTAVVKMRAPDVSLPSLPSFAKVIVPSGKAGQKQAVTATPPQPENRTPVQSTKVESHGKGLLSAIFSLLSGTK
jgi:hypothetical protein